MRLNRPALREALFEVLRPVLTARIVSEVDHGPGSVDRIADLLDEAGDALAAARSTLTDPDLHPSDEATP